MWPTYLRKRPSETPGTYETRVRAELLAALHSPVAHGYANTIHRIFHVWMLAAEELTRTEATRDGRD